MTETQMKVRLHHVWTRICEECGLPTKVCSAITAYRIAFKHYEKGLAGDARDMVEFAEECMADYEQARKGEMRND